MPKIHYQTIGILLFFIGLWLSIDMPWHSLEVSKSSDSFDFINRHTSIRRVVAGAFQGIGILLFLKWLKEEKNDHFKIYKKYYPMILALLVLGVPLFVNQLLGTTAKTFFYSGLAGVESIEYVKNKSHCELPRDKNQIVECMITIKNYQHQSQRVTLDFSLSPISNSNGIDLFMLQRQEKQIKVDFAISKNEMERWKKSSEKILPKLIILSD